MKASKICLTSLFAFSLLLPFSNLTAQEITTLSEITQTEKEKELDKQVLVKKLANPKPSNTLSAIPVNQKKGKSKTANTVLSKADIISIQKRIDHQKAQLAVAKNNQSLPAEALNEKEKLIKTMEKELATKKLLKDLPVSEAN